jgi:hypothetical protein
MCRALSLQAPLHLKDERADRVCCEGQVCAILEPRLDEDGRDAGGSGPFNILLHWFVIGFVGFRFWLMFITTLIRFNAASCGRRAVD